MDTGAVGSALWLGCEMRPGAIIPHFACLTPDSRNDVLAQHL